MNEKEQYYYNKLSIEQVNIDLEHQSVMNRLIESEEMNLFVMLKPKVTIDGNMYCVLYGDNLHDGIAGFGETIHKAILNFNEQFHKEMKGGK